MLNTGTLRTLAFYIVFPQLFQSAATLLFTIVFKSFVSFLRTYLYCSIIFFLFVSLISVGFSLFDIHFLVFLSVVVILSWFASLRWLFALSFHSCFSLLPLFCLLISLD